MKHILSVHNDLDDVDQTIASIRAGVELKGTNLWILMLAILVASLGLNVNSTAVIIGAMLISPLMGPIMGAGLGLAINDIPLVLKALRNFAYSVAISLLTSTVYFLLSPLNNAHSELLARTSPTIYDVLIAFVGGLAGMIALSSKHKGNVITGVAIATALMPPLCTVGYGLATQQWHFFLGAGYLFLINSVFIAWATILGARIFQFPVVHQKEPAADRRLQLGVYALLLITLLPSIWLSYRFIQDESTRKAADLFVRKNTEIEGSYLLQRQIDLSKKTIVLTYGGKSIHPEQRGLMQQRLVENTQLADFDLQFKQGFSVESSELIKNEPDNDAVARLSASLAEKNKQIEILQNKLDQAKETEIEKNLLLQEVIIQYPSILALSLSPLTPSSTPSPAVAHKPAENLPAEPVDWVVNIWHKGAWPAQQTEPLTRWLRYKKGVEIRLYLHRVQDA